MAEFLTTQGTAYHLENIIINSSKWLVLISPYLSITENFLLRLRDADKRKVKIVIIYGKNELKPEEKGKLQKLENLSLHYCRNLHAKCFINEDCLIITSMNMYEFSEKTNREMGILLKKQSEVDSKVYDEVRSSLDSSRTEDLSRNTLESETEKTAAGKKEEPPNRTMHTSGWAKAGGSLVNFLTSLAETEIGLSKQKQGYCIRCGGRIPHNVNRPYCSKCFDSWEEWENPTYKEDYCHTCGKHNRSSMLYPQCRNCYKKSQKQ